MGHFRFKFLMIIQILIFFFIADVHLTQLEDIASAEDQMEDDEKDAMENVGADEENAAADQVEDERYAAADKETDIMDERDTVADQAAYDVADEESAAAYEAGNTAADEEITVADNPRKAAPGRARNAASNGARNPPAGRAENTAPSGAGNSAPGRAGILPPNRARNATPDRAGNTAPIRGKIAAPGRTGNVAPNRPGNGAPNRVGNAAQGRPINAAPNRAGNVAPGKARNPGPGRAGNAGPGRAGNAAASWAGNVAPSRTGNAAPNRSGNAIPEYSWGSTKDSTDLGIKFSVKASDGGLIREAKTKAANAFKSLFGGAKQALHTLVDSDNTETAQPQNAEYNQASGTLQYHEPNAARSEYNEPANYETHTAQDYAEYEMAGADEQYSPPGELDNDTPDRAINYVPGRPGYGASSRVHNTAPNRLRNAVPENYRGSTRDSTDVGIKFSAEASDGGLIHRAQTKAGNAFNSLFGGAKQALHALVDPDDTEAAQPQKAEYNQAPGTQPDYEPNAARSEYNEAANYAGGIAQDNDKYEMAGGNAEYAASGELDNDTPDRARNSVPGRTGNYPPSRTGNDAPSRAGNTAPNRSGNAVPQNSRGAAEVGIKFSTEASDGGLIHRAQTKAGNAFNSFIGGSKQALHALVDPDDTEAAQPQKAGYNQAPGTQPDHEPNAARSEYNGAANYAGGIAQGNDEYEMAGGNVEYAASGELDNDTPDRARNSVPGRTGNYPPSRTGNDAPSRAGNTAPNRSGNAVPQNSRGAAEVGIKFSADASDSGLIHRAQTKAGNAFNSFIGGAKQTMHALVDPDDTEAAQPQKAGYNQAPGTQPDHEPNAARSRYNGAANYAGGIAQGNDEYEIAGGNVEYAASGELDNDTPDRARNSVPGRAENYPPSRTGHDAPSRASNTAPNRSGNAVLENSRGSTKDSTDVGIKFSAEASDGGLIHRTQTIAGNAINSLFGGAKQALHALVDPNDTEAAQPQNAEYNQAPGTQPYHKPYAARSGYIEAANYAGGIAQDNDEYEMAGDNAEYAASGKLDIDTPGRARNSVPGRPGNYAPSRIGNYAPSRAGNIAPNRSGNAVLENSRGSTKDSTDVGIKFSAEASDGGLIHRAQTKAANALFNSLFGGPKQALHALKDPDDTEAAQPQNVEYNQAGGTAQENDEYEMARHNAEYAASGELDNDSPGRGRYSEPGRAGNYPPSRTGNYAPSRAGNTAPNRSGNALLENSRGAAEVGIKFSAGASDGGLIHGTQTPGGAGQSSALKKERITPGLSVSLEASDGGLLHRAHTKTEKAVQNLLGGAKQVALLPVDILLGSR